MNCDHVRTEMIAYLKGELGEDRKRRLEEHMAMCRDCRQQLEVARRLLSQMEAASEDAVVRKIDEHISAALKAGASDIHFEPQRDNSVLVRYRVDGVLNEVERIEPVMRAGVEARLKMLADMNLEEHSIPQDGRILREIDGKEFDLRVSAIPFIYGEGFVLRILDRSNITLGLDKLHFYPDHMEALRRIIHQPCGLFLTTGPTGSGKTTTLYSIVAELASPAIKTVTIEDPVEYQLPNTSQIQLHKKAGLTFPAGLRSVLRHDPDVVMVGEIRDYETLSIILQTAIIGHMVLSTLHTQDAILAITRLIDVGAEPFLVGASLVGVLAQRLVRRVCSNCKAEAADIDSNDAALKYLGITAEDLDSRTVVRGTGCEACRNTGYKGRAGIYELLEMDRELASMIAERPPASEILRVAREKGFLSMRDDARRKVLDGLTTPEEAVRVVAF